MRVSPPAICVLKHQVTEITYTLPVLVWNMAILQSELDLLLVLLRDLIEAVNQVRVALSSLFEILNLLRCDTAPIAISTFLGVGREKYTSACTASSDGPEW
jgi:hypothetical protein